MPGPNLGRIALRWFGGKRLMHNRTINQLLLSEFLLRNRTKLPLHEIHTGRRHVGAVGTRHHGQSQYQSRHTLMPDVLQLTLDD